MNELLANISFTNNAWAIGIPVVLMIVDAATGFMIAWVHHCANSGEMRRGLGKNLFEILALAVGLVFSNGTTLSSVFLHFISIYIIIMELISICEHAQLLGIKLPHFVVKGLSKAEEMFSKKTEGGESNESEGSEDDDNPEDNADSTESTESAETTDPADSK